MPSITASTPFDDLDDRILPWSQVKIISGLSRTTVWRMQKSGDFPACVQISSNRVGWWQSELLAWRRSRIPRRLPHPKPPTARPTTQATDRLVTDNVEASVAADNAVHKSPSSSGRRKRKGAGPDNQAVFDFGG